MRTLTDRVKQLSLESGFELVGISPATPPDHLAFYHHWLGKGYAGEMGYLSRNISGRSDPTTIVPGAKVLLCVGMIYEPKPQGSAERNRPVGRISKYARGDDYHDIMKEKLLSLLKKIQEFEPETTGRVYVDTGPVLERDIAARAGLGWFGKHTNLIHKRKGSWFFLGEIILNLDLDPDSPEPDHCGSCNLCIDACPTDAIQEPYVLDSRRCISYLTIEMKSEIPRDLRTQIGDWVYGCDVCQEVCPWNKKQAKPTTEIAFQSRPGLTFPDLGELLGLSQEEFSRKFRKSPIKRAKRRGLLRNAAVALGNTGSVEDVPVLNRALKDHEPLVRSHAAWALGRIGGSRAKTALEQASKVEPEQIVRNEIDCALLDCDQNF